MAEIRDLMENKEFTDKLVGTETTEEVIQTFADYGVSVTEQDLDAAFASAQTSSDELNEDDLGNVSGGVVGECVALGYLLIKVGDKTGSWKWWRNKLGV